VYRLTRAAGIKTKYYGQLKQIHKQNRQIVKSVVGKQLLYFVHAESK